MTDLNDIGRLCDIDMKGQNSVTDLTDIKRLHDIREKVKTM